MRLADRIVEQAATGTLPMRDDWRVWAGKIERADRYVVDASAGQLSFGTTEASPMRAARARSGTTLPAPLTWFEWTGPSAAMGPRADKMPRPGSVVPLRSGVLVEAKDTSLRYGLMSWIYEMPGGQIEPTPLGMLFDWRDEPEDMPDLGRLLHRIVGRSWEREVVARFDSRNWDSFDIDHVLREERRWGAVVCPNLPTFWSHLTVAAAARPDIVRTVLDNAFADLEGEPKFVMGLLMCMGTAGLLDVVAADDLDRLNAARRKRGRTLLLPTRRLCAGRSNVIRLSQRGGALETALGFHAA